MNIELKVPHELVDHVFTNMLWECGTITDKELEHLIQQIHEQNKHILSKKELATINKLLSKPIDSLNDDIREIIEHAINFMLKPKKIYEYPKPPILTLV
jgi:glutamyl-tRNA reductase